jgi:hypothetical protein
MGARAGPGASLWLLHSVAHEILYSVAERGVWVGSMGGVWCVNILSLYHCQRRVSV